MWDKTLQLILPYHLTMQKKVCFMQNSNQRTIKDEFSNCTVLTVAHRLKTILDCDQIAVLSDGRLKEVGHPGVNATKPFSLSLMAGRST